MAWDNIPVVIRMGDDDDSASKPFGTCSSTDLDDLPRVVSRWGTVPEGDVAGQFNVELGAFQIVVVTDD